MNSIDYKVDNCSWLNKCSLKFSELNETDDSNIRHCAICDEKVYFCQTTEELKAHIVQKHCVAFRCHTAKRKSIDDLVGYLDISNFLRKV